MIKMNQILFILMFLSFSFSQEMAPTFFLTTLKGDNFFASEKYGSKAKEPKTTVISFSASWCAPCQKEIKALDSLVLKYPEVNIYLIDYREKKDIVLKWKNRLGTKIPILLDRYGLVAKKFGVDETEEKENQSVILPALFVMNKKGEIIYSHTGYEDKDANILEDVLQKQR